MLVSNEALSALEHHPIGDVLRKRDFKYNDVMRWLYDAFYRSNIECDFLPTTTRDFQAYDLVLVPALYTAEEALLDALKQYVADGGHLLATFKTGFTDENVKVWHDDQPHHLTEVFGLCYQEFTDTPDMRLWGENSLSGATCSAWEELLIPTTAKVLASYDNPAWQPYAAVTENVYGKGKAWYLGCYFSPSHLEQFVRSVIAKALPVIRPCDEVFPRIIRTGYNAAGHRLTYYLNYSDTEQSIAYAGRAAKELTTGRHVEDGTALKLAPWGVRIVEEDA
jgi:beta-galactosidase